MPWNLFAASTDGRSMWLDLRRGRLSFFGRLVLSVAGFGAALSLCLVAIAISAPNHRVQEEVAMSILAFGALLWVLLLAWLWVGHAVMGPLLRGLFVVAAIWFVVILLAVFIASRLPNDELWIGALIVAGITGTILYVASVIYTGLRGREIHSHAGMVNVQCAECGYSLVGKTDCTCPECGRQYTVDELIALQDYDALRWRPEAGRASEPAARAAAQALHRPVLPGESSR